MKIEASPSAFGGGAAAAMRPELASERAVSSTRRPWRWLARRSRRHALRRGRRGRRASEARIGFGKEWEEPVFFHFSLSRKQEREKAKDGGRKRPLRLLLPPFSTTRGLGVFLVAPAKRQRKKKRRVEASKERRRSTTSPLSTIDRKKGIQKNHDLLPGLRRALGGLGSRRCLLRIRHEGTVRFFEVGKRKRSEE